MFRVVEEFIRKERDAGKSDQAIADEINGNLGTNYNGKRVWEWRNSKRSPADNVVAYMRVRMAPTIAKRAGLRISKEKARAFARALIE